MSSIVVIHVEGGAAEVIQSDYSVLIIDRDLEEIGEPFHYLYAPWSMQHVPAQIVVEVSGGVAKVVYQIIPEVDIFITDFDEEEEEEEEDLPDGVRYEHLEFLDDLRESGATNMFGAGSYVESWFGVGKAQAKQIVLYWMETFAERHKEGS